MSSILSPKGSLLGAFEKLLQALIDLPLPHSANNSQKTPTKDFCSYKFLNTCTQDLLSTYNGYEGLNSLFLLQILVFLVFNKSLKFY